MDVLNYMHGISPKVSLLMKILAITSLVYPGNLVFILSAIPFWQVIYIHINTFLAVIVTLLAIIRMTNVMHFSLCRMNQKMLDILDYKSNRCIKNEPIYY